MAVPVGKRTESKFEVVTKAIELVEYTMRMCSNEKIFPKRERWLLANRIVALTLEISEEIDFANEIYVSLDSDYELRRMAQTTAIGTIGKVTRLMDIANKLLEERDAGVYTYTKKVKTSRISK